MKAAASLGYWCTSVAIKAVLFDLDGTLYDRDELVQRLVSRQYDAFRHELSSVSKGRFIERVVQLDDHGYGDKPDLYRTVAGEWSLSAELADRLLQSFWSLYEQTTELSEDTSATLQTLHAHGVKLGVVTNGRVEWQQRKLDALGISSWFDAVLISEAEGVRKPDPEIFRRALTRCGVEAPEAMFVGDHPQVDVEGAMRAGLHAVWKAVPYWSCAHDVPRLGRLSELPALCLTDAPQAMRKPRRAEP